MKKILVIWDIILDKYSYGRVKRINPEWPMPLLDIEKEEYRIGWAWNIAMNISVFQPENIVLIWWIWDDEMWNVVKKICKENNILLENIWTKTPTITKQRFIDITYHQQLLRVDYEKKYRLEDDKIQEILNLIKKYDFEYLIVSDYEKWFVTKELIDELKKLEVKIIVDSKKKDMEIFKWVYLIKPNFKEFCQSIWIEIQNEDWEIEKYGRQFVEEYDCNLIITRSEKWASLITKTWEYYHISPTKTKEIFDVTWAWDTFTAFTTLALNNWYSLQDAVRKWNEASWIVIGKLGTEKVEKGELVI